MALGLLLAVAVACGESRPPSGASVATPDGGEGLPLDRIELPPGFEITLWAGGVRDARSLSISPGGTVFIGSRKAGLVRAARDEDGDGRADRLDVIDSGLTSPNGVAFRDGDLWVAERSRILRYRDIERRLSDPPEPEVVTDAYPTKSHHGWKFIAFDPKGRLTVPVGAPCNVCDEPDPFASITRLRVEQDGPDFEVIAQGVRNTVGFDWHPETGELWFTDNGRDLLGDDIPPDELNRAARDGLDFGFPRCHGRDVVDPAFGEAGDCERSVPPARELGPHVAALGMRFYVGEQFPAEYRGDVFIAEHGSWNRSTPIGYRITRVPVEGSEATGYEVFASGWLEGSTAWGRPVDVAIAPDGSLLVSDDHAGAIYRIAYVGEAAER